MLVGDDVLALRIKEEDLIKVRSILFCFRFCGCSLNNLVRTTKPLWCANVYIYRPISPSRLVVHHTRGRWLWGGTSLQQGKDFVVKKKSELCIISYPHRLTWTSGRIAVLHPLPPGTTVTATKTIGKFGSPIFFYWCLYPRFSRRTA